MKNCLTCGSLFTPAGQFHNYCSPRCRPSTPPSIPDDRRKCPTCGTEFTRIGRAQRYCSPGCRVSQSREYVRREAIERRGGLRGTRGRKPDLTKRTTVKEMHAAGMTNSQIAAKLGVTPQAISMMLKKMKSEPPPAAG